MNYRLGLNTGFAVNRYATPEEWVSIIGSDLDLRFAQMTADMINPQYPDKIISEQVQRINNQCNKFDVSIESTFTGAFTRVNHLAHPDKSIQNYWIEWFKRFIDISVDVGAKSMGSHFGIFTMEDDRDPKKRQERRAQNIENWHKVGLYAKKKGLEFLTFEPMSITREQAETLVECERLYVDVNENAPIDFKICLDVDHGDLASKNPDDTDPYAWLKKFGNCSPIIHLKQSLGNKSGHYPFTDEFNQKGRIEAAKVLKVLKEAGNVNSELILEHSFREREPADSTVVKILKESVDYWKDALQV
mgnify:CR=1 FL=1